MNFFHKICTVFLLLCCWALLSCSGGGGQNQSGTSSSGKKTGKVLVNDQQITTDSNDQSQPAVAFDNVLHQYLTVWTDSRNQDGSTDIYGRITQGKSLYDDGSYDPVAKTGGVLAFDNDPRVQPNNATGWQKVGTPPLSLNPEIRITDVAYVAPAQHRDQRQPKVAFCPDTVNSANSKYLVVWSDSRNGYSQIFGQFLKADGSYLKPDGVTSSPTPSNFPVSGHVNATGSLPLSWGTGTVAVTGAQSPSISNGTVAVAQNSATVTGAGTTFVASGIQAGDIFFISSVPYAVASVTSDTVLTLTTPYVGFAPAPANQSGSGFFYQSFRYSAAPSAIIAGTGTSFLTDQIQPGDKIGINGVFYQIKSVNSQTQLTLTGPASNSYTGTGLSYQTTAHVNQSDPDIIFNPISHHFVVGWADISDLDTNNTMQIQGAKCSNAVLVDYIPHPIADDNLIMTVEIDAATGAIGNKNPISTLLSLGSLGDDGAIITASWSAQASESKPKLAFRPSTGENYVAWSGINKTVQMSVKYAGDPSPATTCTYSGPVFSSSTVDFLLGTATPATKIKVRYDAGLGLVSDSSFGNLATAPTLAVDPNTNRMLVAWEDNGNGGTTGKDIFGQLIDLSSFRPYGNQVNVSSVIGDQSSPVAAFDNVNQRFLVAWEDARNQSANISNIDIYSQFIDPQGQLSGGNTIVTVAPSNQLAPAVAFGDVYFRKFLVIWKDGRLNNNADIYGQLLEFSTLPQLVITDSLDIPIYNGAIDFGNVDISTATPFKDVIFKIRNDGNTQLTIATISDPAAPFSFMTPKPVTVSPGTSASMTVRFAPTGAGSYAGSPTNGYKMVLNSDGGQAVVYFSGAGVGNLPLSIASTTLPDAAAGSVYTSTALTANGGVVPYRSWTITSGSLPPGLSLNPATGLISGTVDPAALASYSFAASVTDQAGTTVSKSFAIAVTSMSISNSSLKPWTQLQSGYRVQLAASIGGSAVDPTKITWAVVGPMPQGLALTPSGLITDVSPATGPVLSGASSITVLASYTDPANKTFTATKTLSLTINPALLISTSSLPGSVVGSSYSQPLSMFGGTPSYSWSLAIGSLPPGISMDASTGSLTGISTGTGTFSFTVQGADSTGATVQRTFTIQINPLLDIANPTSAGGGSGLNPPSSATVGTRYSYQFSAIGGSAPYSWTVTGGGIPTGLTPLNPFSGFLGGTPSEEGPFTFKVQVTDSNGFVVSKIFSILVYQAVTSTTPGIVSQWTKGVPYSNPALTAAGGTGSYSWSLSAGALPHGISLSSAGVLSGTPDVSGTFLFTVKATDGNASSATQSFSMTIANTPVIQAAVYATGTVNAVYSQTQTVVGGTAPYSWSISNGTLPAGLNIDSTTGTISGVPTAAVASKGFTVQVTDAAGVSATYSPSITVTNGSVSTGNVVLTDSNGAQVSSLAFANVLAGHSGPVRALFLTNNGASDITTGSFTVSDTAFSATVPQGYVLKAGASVSVSVLFSPAAAKSYSGTLSIKDSAGATLQTLSLSGTGSIALASISAASTGTTLATVISSSTIDPLAASLNTAAKPANFTIASAISVRLDNVTPLGTVNVDVTFLTLPASPLFYKVTNNVWTPVSPVSQSGNTVTFAVTDNNVLHDSDMTAGFIQDPIVVGSTGSGTGTGTTDPGTGTGTNTPAPASGGKSGCFIATAAFGSYLDPHVMVLRHFRDEVLLKSRAGTAFVHCYYRYSPPVADFIAKHTVLRVLTRWALTPLIFAVKYHWSLPLLACGALLFSGYRKRRRAERLVMARDY
jgi:hypothetical protein